MTYQQLWCLIMSQGVLTDATPDEAEARFADYWEPDDHFRLMTAGDARNHWRRVIEKLSKADEVFAPKHLEVVKGAIDKHKNWVRGQVVTGALPQDHAQTCWAVLDELGAHLERVLKGE